MTLTVEKMRHIAKVLRRNDASVDGCIPVPPQFYQTMARLRYEAGFIDRWEAWRLLYNTGLRGRELARDVGIR